MRPGLRDTAKEVDAGPVVDMDPAQAKTAVRSDSATTSDSGQHGKELCRGGVYLFHDPEGIPEVEIVFIHGLQLGKDDIKNAYRRAWLARDGTEDNCWPMTWLPRRFPNARILSLSYDASLRETPTTGRMDFYSLGESLVQQMTFSVADIGQKGCPVVFVCHSLGGLIAKQIVVSGHRLSSKNEKICKLLANLKAFFFFATPHGGSKLADLAGLIPFLKRSPLVENLQVLNVEVVRLSSEFDEIYRELGSAWIFYDVGEMHATSYGFPSAVAIGAMAVCVMVVSNMAVRRTVGAIGAMVAIAMAIIAMFGSKAVSAMVVGEESARSARSKFIGVAANHIDVCKPQSETDTGFLHLTRCINEVLKVNKKSHGCRLDLPSCLVGMEGKLQKVREKLAEHSIVGLVGMGGIGKTTLSKKIYMEDKGAFQRCCFLGDVRTSDPEVCQRRLFHDLCGEKWDENKKEEMLERIKACIMQEKVLLVLDDVDTKKNMKDLLVDSFRDCQHGSKVIVTTRRQDILKSVYPQGILHVELLTNIDASELFSYYAFAGVNEKDHLALNTRAMAIIKACGNLPLSLEVIGQFLREHNSEDIQKRMNIWDNALKRLKKAQALDGSKNDEGIWARLRISYDDLLEGEQSMFLDFACVVCETCAITGEVGVRQDWLERIWNDSIGVRNLINRSLIKWNEEKKVLVMHDQLRDMGRSIVTKEGNRRSRMWDKHGLAPMVKNESLKALEGLILSKVSFQGLQKPSMEGGQAKCMEKLRLMNLRESDVEVVEHYIGLCGKELRWLCLDRTRITVMSIQALESFAKLRVLEMRDCPYLEELPACIAELSKLSELVLSGCKGLKTLLNTLTKLEGLTVLDVRRCSNIKKLPESFGGLQRLRELKLGRAGIKSLPQSFGQLSTLEVLDLGYCQCLVELPESFGRLQRLRELKLAGAGIKSLPQSFGQLSTLEVLDLARCWYLVELPESFGGLQRLRELKLGGGGIKSLPQSFGQLSTLEVLDLEYSQCLVELPESFGGLQRLRELKLWGTGINSLPESFGHLSSLQVLDLNYSWHLVELSESFAGLQRLRELKLGGGGIKRLPESVGQLSTLEMLDLKYCWCLVELPESFGGLQRLRELKLRGAGIKSLPESFGQLSTLEVLDLEYCQCLLELPESFGGLQRLRELKLWGDGIKSLPESFGQLSTLEVLDLGGCKYLVELPESFGGLQRLRVLTLGGGGIKSLRQSFGQLSTLEVLDLGGCKYLVELPESFGGLQRLRELKLGGGGIKSLPESFGHLSTLEVLDLSDCQCLVELPESFGGLQRLRELKLRGDGIKSLPESFGHLSTLEVLDLCVLDLGVYDVLVELLESYGGLQRLRELTLGGGEIKSLPESFGQLSTLEVLDLGGCKYLVELPESFGGLQRLRELKLRGAGIMSLPESFGQLSTLEVLYLEYCQCLLELPESFGGLQRLQELKLGGGGIKSLPESFGQLSTLEVLDLSDCQCLVELPESFGGLQRLRELKLRGAGIMSLPESFGQLSTLDVLYLEYCQCLLELPESFGGLQRLQELKLGGGGIKSLPESFGQLSTLEVLDLSDCQCLVELPESFGGLQRLRELKLQGAGIKSLPESFGQLSTLEVLDLGGCKYLVELPESFGGLQRLRELKLWGGGIKSLPESFGLLSTLEVLDLNWLSVELPKSFGGLQRLL